jgi:hypothetical protein
MSLEQAKKIYFAALKEERKKLVEKIAEIDAALGVKREKFSRTSPCKNPEMEAVENFCEGFLRTQPIATPEELLEGLKLAGLELFGKNPKQTLYFRLHRCDKFAYRRGMGWSLANG